MLILVSNDDGVQSPGIRILADALRCMGDVYIIATDRERSAASHALTLHKPLRLDNIGDNIYAVNGTPTDCINLGVNGVLHRKPDLVVSGINRGGNLGDDVTYSGTVSAAIVEKVDPRGKKYYWIGGSRLSWEDTKDSDFSAIEAGMISITPLRLDLTEFNAIKELRKWESTLDERMKYQG